MRITVVGAILIVAGVVAGVFLILALNEAKTRQTDPSKLDQSVQHKMGA